MTAREYFENARAAQRRIDGCLARIEAMRSREGVRAQRYDAIGKSYGGDHDVMRMTDARIDAESRIASEVAELRAIVEDARAVCSGIRAANPEHAFWGDVLELRFCDCEQWYTVASFAELRAIVEDARAVCSGIRAANPEHAFWGDVLELRFCDCEQWYTVASSLCISVSYAKLCCSAALDWVDLVGLAAAREGRGQAALF